MSNLPIANTQIVPRVLWLAVAFAAGCGLIGHSPTSIAEEASAVRLTIDYGDGVQKTFTSLPWKDKLTVFDALQAAEKHSHGIQVTFTGKDDTIFITAIDDTMNEGTNGSNWRYTVNDQPARYSAGIAELKSGDAVIWRFGK